MIKRLFLGVAALCLAAMPGIVSAQSTPKVYAPNGAAIPSSAAAFGPLNGPSTNVDTSHGLPSTTVDASGTNRQAITAAGATGMAPVDGYGHSVNTFTGTDLVASGTVANTATLISSSGHTLQTLEFTQFNAQVGCFDVFDATSAGAVTLGTTVPKIAKCVTAAAASKVEIPSGGIPFFSGIVVACTGAPGASSATAGTTACSYDLTTGYPPVNSVSVVTDPSVWAATTMSSLYAGTIIDPSKLGTPIWDARALGFADVIADAGTTTQSGAHTIYASSGQYGCVGNAACQNYTPSSAINPWGVDANGNLTCLMQWDAVNSKYVFCQGNSSSTEKFRRDGWDAPGSNHYYEMEMSAPAPPTGVIPWLALWEKNTNALDIINNTAWLNKNVVTEVDIETGLNGSSVTGSAVSPYYPIMTLHGFCPANTVVTLCPGGSNVQHFINSPKGVLYYNLFDGNHHFLGIASVGGYYVFYLDRKEQYRIRKTGVEMDLSPMTLKFNWSANTLPTFSAGTTYQLTIYNLRAWSCTPSNGCPVN